MNIGCNMMLYWQAVLLVYLYSSWSDFETYLATKPRSFIRLACHVLEYKAPNLIILHITDQILPEALGKVWVWQPNIVIKDNNTICPYKVHWQVTILRGPIPKWKSCNEVQFWFYDMCKLLDFSNCPV